MSLTPSRRTRVNKSLGLECNLLLLIRPDPLVSDLCCLLGDSCQSDLFRFALARAQLDVRHFAFLRCWDLERCKLRVKHTERREFQEAEEVSLHATLNSLSY